MAQIVHAHGRRMNAHARSADSVKMCVRHGVDIIYHANFADEEALDMIEANKDRHFVSPNIGYPTVAVFEGAACGLRPDEVKDLGFPEELEGACNVMKALHKRGVRVLGGGDYGFAWNPHGDYAKELTFFVDYVGFSPVETIKCATKTGAEIMGLGDEVGTLEPGKLADVLVVDGDVAADISLLEDRSNFIAVMQAGAVKAGQLTQPGNGF